VKFIKKIQKKQRVLHQCNRYVFNRYVHQCNRYVFNRYVYKMYT